MTGGVAETTDLLALKWDHIFYTGNGMVARIVMTAAAKHLTPVTLELGGKSPAFVCDDVDMKMAAKRLLWGKFMNAGQTCVAPDYIIVSRATAPKLKQALIDAYAKLCPDGCTPESVDFSHMITPRHARRVIDLAAPEADKIIIGDLGAADADASFVPLMVAWDVAPDAPIMKEEIFGPVMPVVIVDSIDAGIDMVTAGDKPLALYVFGKSKKEFYSIVGRTSSGSAAHNDVIVHLSHPHLPFGGVGESGMGMYHGVESFNCFTHWKSVMHKGTTVQTDSMVRYPPYKHPKMLKNFMDILG